MVEKKIPNKQEQELFLQRCFDNDFSEVFYKAFYPSNSDQLDFVCIPSDTNTAAIFQFFNGKIVLLDKYKEKISALSEGEESTLIARYEAEHNIRLNQNDNTSKEKIDKIIATYHYMVYVCSASNELTENCRNYIQQQISLHQLDEKVLLGDTSTDGDHQIEIIQAYIQVYHALKEEFSFPLQEREHPFLHNPFTWMSERVDFRFSPSPFGQLRLTDYFRNILSRELSGEQSSEYDIHQPIRIACKRKDLLKDPLTYLLQYHEKVKLPDLSLQRLQVSFEGEDGQDAGGIS